MICKKYHFQFSGKFCRRCGAPVIHLLTLEMFRKCTSYLAIAVPFIVGGVILFAVVFGIVQIKGCVSAYNQRIEKEEANFRDTTSPQWIALLEQVDCFYTSDKKIEAVKNFTSVHAEKDCSFEVLRRLTYVMQTDDTRLQMIEVVLPVLKEPLSPDEKTKILNMFYSDDSRQTFMTRVYKKP